MIGINYGYKNISNINVLGNYCLFTGFFYNIIDSENQYQEKHTEIHKRTLEDIQTGKLLYNLDISNDSLFDSPLLKQILISAYPIEISYKILGENIKESYNHKEIMSILENIFDIDYSGLCSMSIDVSTVDMLSRYKDFSYGSDRKVYIGLYLSFIKKLFYKYGYIKEVDSLLEFFNKFLLCKEGKTSFTRRGVSNICIYVNNFSIATLFHELTHAVNVYFREFYYNKSIPSYTLIKRNEGLANFMAFNCYDNIVNNSNIVSDPIFVSIYSLIYQQLFFANISSRDEIREIIKSNLLKVSPSYSTKIDDFIFRFYKFFLFDQSKYLYPKELLYQAGYDLVLDEYRKEENKELYLIRCLLGVDDCFIGK